MTIVVRVSPTSDIVVSLNVKTPCNESKNLTQVVLTKLHWRRKRVNQLPGRPVLLLNSLKSDKLGLLKPIPPILWTLYSSWPFPFFPTDFPFPSSVTSFLSLFLKDACKMKGCSPRPCLITVFRACKNLAAPQLFR